MLRIPQLVCFAWGGVFFYVAAPSASAQTPREMTPCGVAIGAAAPIRRPEPFSSGQAFKTKGLVPVFGGLIYDENQGLCWLADANLAGEAMARALVSPLLTPTNPDPYNAGPTVPVINPDGTMGYETALNWVNAVNKFNGGKGWLNHNDWQLPTSTNIDTNCSSKNGGNFGVLCTASAMDNLYKVGLARSYPDSVLPNFPGPVTPFVNLQPGLYWSGTSNSGGYSTFSFNTGDNGANTTAYNFLHVLPVTQDVLGPLPTGHGVLPYLAGPGAGKAVYDSHTGLSWIMDANLAATNHFGFNSTVVLDTNHGDPDVNHSAFPMTVPMIDTDGAMHFSAVCAPATPTNSCPTPATGWIVSMNSQNYAGSIKWSLPGIQDLINLYADLGLPAGDTRLESTGFAGPFYQLQPGFYWSCERADSTANNQVACDSSIHPPSSGAEPMAFSFNFDDGFQGTDQIDKHFYVMLYFPAPPKR